MARDKKKKREDFEDDGRTIADMNIDGMPWYTGRSDRRKLPEDKDLHRESDGKTGTSGEPLELSAKETRAMMKGVMLAVLVAGAIFLVVFGGFILFCIYVWFR